MSYTTNKHVDGSFDEVVETTIDALEDAGFGVLCDIDVQATFEKKLDESFRQYRILGACNPELAHRGLEDELELGTLLPCNVVVYEDDAGDVVVSAVDPGQLLAVADNPALESVGDDASERFEQVFEQL
ncbi:DUF302 domain-containing protein [Natronorubrum aibiense]|uniref:DUF302 domain-containing protein n=1 Tax=Natronorubrum aibiense TaxID=348826 RepID=A0A5P9P4R1_9EURY|nr:DUF302 domain-containing protein [Natronorubrum aibiense]QFU83135.1 DUF302 domain-containing protein [Natronorubrum aibiense]